MSQLTPVAPVGPDEELDRIWNDIRSTLASAAMRNMTIPQAKVFSVEAAMYIGGHVRKLVDVEIAAHTASAVREATDIAIEIMGGFDGAEGGWTEQAETMIRTALNNTGGKDE